MTAEKIAKYDGYGVKQSRADRDDQLHEVAGPCGSLVTITMISGITSNLRINFLKRLTSSR